METSDPASGNTWFNGSAVIGGELDIDAGNAGETKLSNTTYVHILPPTMADFPEGPPLQSVSFHTSCSQPLNTGDQYRSVILRSFVPE